MIYSKISIISNEDFTSTTCALVGVIFIVPVIPGLVGPGPN